MVPEGDKQLKLVTDFINDSERKGLPWGDQKSRDRLKRESQTEAAEVFMPKFEKIKATYDRKHSK